MKETTMHCTQCGAKLDDSASFCTACGTPVANARSGHEQAIPTEQTAAANKPSPFTSQSKPASAAPQGTGQTPAKNNSAEKKLVVSIVIAAAVVVILIAAAVFILIGQGEQEEAAAPSQSTMTIGEATPTFENAIFRITFPADVADKVSFKEEGNSVYIMYAPSNTTVAWVYPRSDGPEYDIEYIYDRYELGNADVAGKSEVVSAEFPFLDSDNKALHWGRVKEPMELGITKLLGLRPDEFAACIELKTASGFTPASAKLVGGKSNQVSTGSSIVSSATPSSAFWGIWGEASKNKAEAEAEAERIRNTYGLDAFVVLTTDWSNLNSEPWYCVSIGSYPSESEANAALSKARAADSSAYVKYSGSRK